jgi:hypothetical protein
MRVELNRLEYVFVPTEGQKFPTEGAAVDAFVAKYFADGTAPIDIDSLGPAEYKEDVLEGRRRRGMTKEQVYASLGPPWKINDNTSAMTLSRAEILASDHWIYPLKWLLVAPDLTDLYFGDGLLQKMK